MVRALQADIYCTYDGIQLDMCCAYCRAVAKTLKDAIAESAVSGVIQLLSF